MAAPHVSGVAGLIFSINPNLTGQEVRDIIEQTAQKLPCYVFDSIAINGTRNDTVAYGLLDAHRAVLKAAYHKVYGDTALTLCDTSHHAYTVRAPHNANIDSVSFFWTCSDNLQMVSGQNTDSVWVKRINSGVAQLQCHIIHDGDTVTSALYIPVVSGRTVYDNVSLDNSISFPDTFVLSRVVTIDSLAGVDWQDKTVLCTPDCRIVVRPGGSMVLSHTTLTPACPNEMWQGIEVVGDRTQPQNPHKQGMLHIENGCIIEHALTAVRNWLATDGDFTTTGGVVHAYASSFRNNGKAIEFNTYDYSPQPGLMPDYTTLFSQCTFTVNDQNRFAANGTAFTEHVRLCGVKGVAFKGCSFSDSTTSPTPGRRGVFTDDAGFSLDTYCDMAYNGCECPESHATYTTFSGFTTAVEVNTTGNPYPVSVNEARFSNNGTGIRINGNNFATVTRNTFNLQSAPYAVSNIGLRLDNCTGYKVEANTFSKITYTPQQLNSIGIYVNNSGNAANLLHLNSFSNLNYGIRAAGNNGWTWSGLQFTCNDFSWCGRDFYVAQNATVAKYIGSVSVGADNEFHNTRSSSLYNAGSQQIVYRFSSETNHNPYNPVNITAITVNTANSCASTLCNSGWNPKLLLAGFQSGMNAYNAALADNTDMDGMGNADGAGVETQDFASLQQALSESYYTAVRALIADSLLDLAALEQWHTAAQPIADPYSLTETQFCEGYAETFAENADDAELANYAEFHAMKLALRNQNDNMDNQNNNHSSNLPNSPTTSPSVNWYALTPAQIAQLQTIAERNTGRASVMAKGVLCFFFDICYENDNLLADEDGDADAETRAKHTAIHTADDAALNVHPNPTADLLHIELSDTEIATVALYDLQGRLVYSPNSPNSPINLRNVPAGVYILRVTDAQNRQFHHKIIIK